MDIDNVGADIGSSVCQMAFWLNQGVRWRQLVGRSAGRTPNFCKWVLVASSTSRTCWSLCWPAYYNLCSRSGAFKVTGAAPAPASARGQASPRASSRQLWLQRRLLECRCQQKFLTQVARCPPAHASAKVASIQGRRRDAARTDGRAGGDHPPLRSPYNRVVTCSYLRGMVTRIPPLYSFITEFCFTALKLLLG
jgi:hypothetical protein